jgi:hypothetical protein
MDLGKSAPTKKELAKALRIATREYDEAWGAVYNADEGNCLHAAALDGILKAMDDLDLWRKRRDIVQVTPKKQLKALKLVRDKALKRLEALQAQDKR